MTIPLRIVHIGKFYPPEYGGIESVTEALADDHAALGNEVEVVCFTRKKDFRNEKKNPKIIRCYADKVLASQPISIKYLAAGIRSIRSADVVHIHVPNILGAIISLFTSRRTVQIIHWHCDILNKGMIGKLLRPLERLMLKKSTAIVCTSKPYLETSKMLQNFSHKSHVIPIGISDVADSPRLTAERDDFILFVGRLVPYKGLDLLLRAIAEMHRECRVVIVGSGPEEKQLRSLAKTLGVKNKIEFLGRVEDEKMHNLLRDAALFCLPSINRIEAFGVVLVEAMRAGCPIVTSDIPGSGVPWVNASGLTFKTGDYKALATKLELVLEDPELQKRLSEQGRKRYEALFTREKMSRSFLELYLALQRNRSAPNNPK